MAAATLPDNVTYTISQTHNGWLLVIENAHCSLSQVYQSSSAARQAVDRAAFALETLTDPAPGKPAAPIGRRPNV